VLERVAITGASGRLGSALLAELSQRDGSMALPWRRPEYDLDSADPARLFDRDRPSLVIHAAAWTDVDGCAREPALAIRRNADAVASLSRACVARGVPLVLISTNEVFDGDRSDGLGYTEADPPRPGNPYGASKLAGEEAAQRAFGTMAGLWIARTGWLYGPPGNDFPEKILAASDRRGEEEPLPVVADETGSPTFTRDLARAMLELVGAVDGGLYHLVNAGIATRYDWADAVLDRCRPGRRLRPISRRDFVRASAPPAWSVLDGGRAARVGVSLRDWRAALSDYLDLLC
jgi:dTDP-4-dehydrorhamnose reductase